MLKGNNPKLGRKSHKKKEEVVVEEQVEEEKPSRQKKILNYNYTLKQLIPLTKNQEQVFRSYLEGQHLLLHGSPGTGKTICALYLALKDLLAGYYSKIIIIRSACSGRQVGFLPGDLSIKLASYEKPYEALVANLCGKKDAYESLKKKEVIQFESTSFLRGITFEDSIIIFDEFQNCNLHEVNGVFSRIGENCRMIVSGDTKQSDLENFSREKSGGHDLINICEAMKSFDTIKFEIRDIVRSGFVREFLMAKIAIGLE